jgi:hypothetical protein
MHVVTHWNKRKADRLARKVKSIQTKQDNIK